MLRSEIIAEAFKLLNETSTGTWDEPELYLLARAKERELVRILQDKYSRAFLNDFPLVTALAVGYMATGEAYALPTANGFVKEIGVYTNSLTAGENWATYVNFKDLDTYKFNDFAPTKADPIYWFEEQGIGVSPIKETSPDFNYTLVYLKEPDAWIDGNKGEAPLIHEDTHSILVLAITSQALYNDGEIPSAQVFEKQYKEGCQLLGLNRKFVSPKEVKK